MINYGKSEEELMAQRILAALNLPILDEYIYAVVRVLNGRT